MQKLNDLISKDESNDLEAYSRELYNAFINSKEVYDECIESGFTNDEIYDHIGLFTDLKEAREKEKLIKTYDDCLKYNLFYKMKIVKKGFVYEKEYDALDAYKNYLKYLSSFLFKDFSHEFDTVSVKKVDNKNAKFEITKKLKNKNWVYLVGAKRSGKSYLAIAYLNACVNKHPEEKVAFIDCRKRFSELGDLFFKDKEDFNIQFNKLVHADTLVLDNFGSEYRNSYIRDNVVLPLLNARSSEQKMTFFTSSYDFKKIKNIYANKNDAFDKIKAEEIVEILIDKCESEIIVSQVSLY